MFRYTLPAPTVAAGALALAAILGVGLAPAPPALAAGHAAKRQDPGERIGDHGRIDWNKGVLYATGLGAIPNNEPNQAKAYLSARGFAKLDALRNLLMVVDHVRIDSRTIGKDFVTASDEIRAEVNGIIRGAQVVGERQLTMGNGRMVEVTVATPMYGDQGIASVFLPELARRNRAAIERNGAVEPQPTPAPPDVPDAPVVQPPDVRPAPDLPSGGQEPGIDRVPSRERFTSVIVDARGLGIWRSMSPKLRRADGSELWGTLTVNPDFVIEHGIVGYAHSLAEARRLERAGDNPLVVRAVGRVKGPFPSDPLLSDDDAARIAAADAATGFLGRFHVIFLIDAGH